MYSSGPRFPLSGILVFQHLSSLPQPAGKNSSVTLVSWRWSFFLVIPSASAISENLGFGTVGQFVKQQERAKRDRWLWMREHVSVHLPFGFCWCFVVTRAFEAVILRWLSGSCSFAGKIGLWHLLCVPLISCGAPGQAPSAEDGSAFALEDMERVWETSGFSAWKSGCVFPDLFSLTVLDEACRLIPLLGVRLPDSSFCVIPV